MGAWLSSAQELKHSLEFLKNKKDRAGPPDTGPPCEALRHVAQQLEASYLENLQIVCPKTSTRNSQILDVLPDELLSVLRSKTSKVVSWSACMLHPEEAEDQVMESFLVPWPASEHIRSSTSSRHRTQKTHPTKTQESTPPNPKSTFLEIIMDQCPLR